LEAHLNAHATLIPSPAYESVIAELNSLITNYNESVQSRRADEDESGEGEAGEPA
jgi:hypothetical protein